MKQENKRIIEKKIQNEIKRISASILEYEKMAKPIAPDDAIGRVSRMDAINNKSVLDAALTKAKMKLEKLLIVQKDINNDNFGLCVRCSCKIPIERLILVPESKRCVYCA